jgi:hypothetical protein
MDNSKKKNKVGKGKCLQDVADKQKKYDENGEG